MPGYSAKWIWAASDFSAILGLQDKLQLQTISEEDIVERFFQVLLSAAYFQHVTATDELIQRIIDLLQDLLPKQTHTDLFFSPRMAAPLTCSPAS